MTTSHKRREPGRNPHALAHNITWCPSHSKKVYGSRQRARAAIRDLHEPGMREYPCQPHRGWHIGHLPTTVITGENTIHEHYYYYYHHHRRRQKQHRQLPIPGWHGRHHRGAMRTRRDLRYRRAVGRQQLANDTRPGYAPAATLMRASDRTTKPDYRSYIQPEATP